MDSNLQFREIAPDVYEALGKLKRTGWVESNVENPETVLEHTISLIRIADEIQSELSDSEKDELQTMLEVHDWPEAVCGDEIVLEEIPNSKHVEKEEKFNKEKQAMEDLCKNVKEGQRLFRLWLRFETGEDPSAQLARQIDKYQAVEQALLYEKEQHINLFDEFYTYTIKHISHPILLRRMESLKGQKELSL